jgi:hypothetical protein
MASLEKKRASLREVQEKLSKLQDTLALVMAFNATFNNISVISWQSVLLVEETKVPGENH